MRLSPVMPAVCPGQSAVIIWCMLPFLLSEVFRNGVFYLHVFIIYAKLVMEWLQFYSWVQVRQLCSMAHSV